MTIPKFRAYIKETGEMKSVGVIDFERKVIWCSCKIKHNSGDYDEFKPFDFDEIVLMQYTGFNDINDIEIYEGDILDDHYKLLVLFKEGIFTVRSKVDTTKKYDLAFLINFRRGAGIPVKIIGSIHQNPELLENQNEYKEKDKNE